MPDFSTKLQLDGDDQHGGDRQPDHNQSSLDDTIITSTSKPTIVPCHHSLDRQIPDLCAPLLEVKLVPGAGFGVFATDGIPKGAELLVAPTPAAHAVYRALKKEVCGWCFRFGGEQSWKVKHVATLAEKHVATLTEAGDGRDPGAEEIQRGINDGETKAREEPFNEGGMVFCSGKCKQEWEYEYGSIGLSAYSAMETFIQRQARCGESASGHANDFEDDSSSDFGSRKPDEKEIKEAWKSVELQASLIRTFRLRSEGHDVQRSLDTQLPMISTSISPTATTSEPNLLSLISLLDLSSSATPTSIDSREELSMAITSDDLPQNATTLRSEILSSIRAEKQALAEALRIPLPDPDLLFFLLSGVLSLFSGLQHDSGPDPVSPPNRLSKAKSDVWATLLMLHPSAPYKCLDSLYTTVNAYLQLLVALPLPLIHENILNQETLETILSKDVGNSFGIWSMVESTVLDPNALSEGAGEGATDDDAEDEDDPKMLGYGIWPIISFFNHSCAPNVAKRRAGRSWVFSAANEIEKGTELCITYIGGEEDSLPLKERREKLNKGWGFVCRCAKCNDETVGLSST